MICRKIRGELQEFSGHIVALASSHPIKAEDIATSIFIV
jgi:hypothetical protein